MSTFVLTAGGTGGHLFPAEALAGELFRRGHRVALMIDPRGRAYTGGFAGAEIVTVPSAAVFGRNPLKLAAAPFKILAGIAVSLSHFKRLRPAAVVGFGGYPSVPVMLAAAMAGYPTAILSPDAVLGRANRLLADRVKKIAANFPLKRFLPKDMGKVVYTGNPLRPTVVALAGAPYDAPTEGGPLRLLVFGGSQGAHFFSEVLPAAIALLPEPLQRRLDLVQQCRPEDLDAVRHVYEGMGIKTELAPFFSDMPSRMAHAHLVIARSGAGTVSELTAIGRPAVLVPLPGALDDNQTPNADALAEAGGGWRIAQRDLTAARLAALLQDIFADPPALTRRAAAALTLGKPGATAALADLVESLEIRK
jgi:UDP-N-acetylglucosamine--N-acetylmuramyl-(pentapeptide) pyrophosphoryl-undecaprenol N-acetylglucosamine transferase